MANKESFAKVGIFIFFIILAVLGGVVIYAFWHGDLKFSPKGQVSPLPLVSADKINPADFKTLKKFSSEQEFKDYLTSHAGSSGYYGIGGEMVARSSIQTIEAAVPMNAPAGMGGDNGTIADRVSETNMQVAGIDEPDIVKTDGKEIYLSVQRPLYRYFTGTPAVGVAEAPVSAKMIQQGEIMPNYQQIGEIKMVMAFPPADLKFDGKIEANGNLLLHKNILVVFDNQNKITAFDVADKTAPKEKWSMDMNKRASLVSARLMDGKIYLAISEGVNYARPCPLEPIIFKEGNLSVSCGDIYYPTVGVDIDTTYTLLAIDAESGKTGNKTSFVGSSGQSIFYMSPEAAYLTYTYMGDLVNFAYDFFAENKDLIPDWMLTKINQLIGYDLSRGSKMSELNVIISRWQSSLTDDENLRIQNELTNRMDKYYIEHRRDLEQTGIIQISLKDLKITATGQVPGRPLNQFSLDEFEKHLRIATTIGENFWGLAGIGGNRKTVNDIYVLDKNLTVSGSLKDLGEDERIYAVRFLGDRGYLVTFRQIDPFFVLNLDNPKNPLLRGELKIPGYSSYLHPLAEHKVLGLGKEDGKVKLSIFDVEVAELPAEISKYSLNEYWSEALNNHHAFLLDEKHQVFFMPGSQGGYIFGYANDELKLLKAISGSQISRAIYLSDYLYLIGSDEIIVLDEKTWETAGKLELK